MLVASQCPSSHSLNNESLILSWHVTIQDKIHFLDPFAINCGDVTEHWPMRCNQKSGACVPSERLCPSLPSCSLPLPAGYLMAGLWTWLLKLEQPYWLKTWNHKIEAVVVPATPALGCLLLNFLYNDGEIYFHHCYFRFHFLPMNLVPTRITMIPFMWKIASKPIYIDQIDDFDFGTETPKIICFWTEDILSYITISPEVEQLDSVMGNSVTWLHHEGSF